MPISRRLKLPVRRRRRDGRADLDTLDFENLDLNRKEATTTPSEKCLGTGQESLSCNIS